MTKAQVIALIDQYITTNGNEEITGAQTNSVMKALANQDIPFADITNKPTTLSGYGITNAYTKSQSDGRYLLKTGGTITGDLMVTRDNLAVVEITGLDDVGGVVGTDTDHDLFLRRNNAAIITLLSTGADVTGDLNVSGTSYVQGNPVWHSGNFNPSNYLPLSGGTMSGDINLGAASVGIARSGNRIFRNNGTSTVLSSINDNIFFRPNGDGNPTGEVTINTSGVISVTGGNSTNWNTAFGWGNHASVGYALKSTQINTGNHLSGGGNLSANRTLTVTPTVDQWILDSQGNQRMFFNSDADVSNGIILKASGLTQKLQYRDVNNNQVFTVDDSGNVTAQAFFESSDRRLKKNIKPLNYGLNEIEKIDTHTWNWKKDGTEDMGLIAQELENVMPELVKTNEEGYKSVNYTKLVPILINSIKELSNEIKALKNG